MDTIKGRIKIELMYEGSKSEGYVATLITDNAGTYILYRKDNLPQNDKFLASFDNMNVEIEGIIDNDDNHVCVSSVTLPDGSKKTPPPLELPIASSPMFINDASDKDIANAHNKNNVKRLPRKLKKKLKRKGLLPPYNID